MSNSAACISLDSNFEFIATKVLVEKLGPKRKYILTMSNYCLKYVYYFSLDQIGAENEWV